MGGAHDALGVLRVSAALGEAARPVDAHLPLHVTGDRPRRDVTRTTPASAVEHSEEDGAALSVVAVDGDGDVEDVLGDAVRGHGEGIR